MGRSNSPYIYNNKRMGRSNSPSFFKVFIHDSFNELRIPTAYIRHFNGDVPKKFILRSPTKRAAWMVSAKENDNGVFLCKEWRSFVKDNTLEFGDFLVFTYNGKSEFSVTIFGSDACEKVLPLALKNDVESISHLKDTTTSQVKEMDSPEKLLSGILQICPEKKRDDEALVMDKMTSLPDSKPLNAERIEKLEANNSFTVTFSPSKKYRIIIPRDLARENGLKQKDNVVFLDPCGRSWSVTIKHRRDRETTLTSGWANFRVENNINIGDHTCLFEFIQGLGDALRVYIFRTSQKAPSGKQATAGMPISTPKRNGPRELINDRAAKYIKQERCTQFGLHLNKMDDGDHLDSNCSNNHATLPNVTSPNPVGDNPNQRKNPEEPQELPSSILYSGVQSNVTKTRTSKSAALSGCIKKASRRKPLESMPSRRAAPQEKERNITMAGATSNKPFCSVTLRSTYVGSRSHALVLPSRFAKKYMKCAPRNVTLRDIYRWWYMACSIHNWSTSQASQGLECICFRQPLERR